MSAIEPEFITVKDTAAFLAIPTARVYSMLNDGLIESRYIGRSRQVLMSSLREYAADLPSTPNEKASA